MSVKEHLYYALQGSTALKSLLLWYFPR